VKQQIQHWEGQHDFVDAELKHPRNQFQKGNYDCIQYGLKSMGQQQGGKYSGQDRYQNCNPASGKRENYEVLM
jgi:hypothetical protein